MKTIIKIMKRILAGLLALGLLGIAVFTVAGLMPVKDPTGAINRSCYVEMDGTRLAVRYSIPVYIELPMKKVGN